MHRRAQLHRRVKGLEDLGKVFPPQQNKTETEIPVAVSTETGPRGDMFHPGGRCAFFGSARRVIVSYRRFALIALVSLLTDSPKGI